MSKQRYGNVEVRLNGDGSVDEIVIYDPNTDKCIFHMEQMDEKSYWMRAYGTEQDLIAHVFSKTGEFDNWQTLKVETGPVLDSNFNWEPKAI